MENQKIDDISKKNLGQLLGVLDSLNCSDAVKTVVKSYFWKNSDDIKIIMGRSAGGNK